MHYQHFNCNHFRYQPSSPGSLISLERASKDEMGEGMVSGRLRMPGSVVKTTVSVPAVARQLGTGAKP